jgi:hypothetical protein
MDLNAKLIVFPTLIHRRLGLYGLKERRQRVHQLLLHLDVFGQNKRGRSLARPKFGRPLIRWFSGGFYGKSRRSITLLENYIFRHF